MGLFSLLLKDPLGFFIIAVPLLYSIIFHELAHGWAAYRLGDPTAKLLGRLSLNPIRHLDPMGTLMLFLFGFGWARPVPVNFNHLRDRRRGMIVVSAAGVATNMLLAFGALLLYRLFSPSASSLAAQLLYIFARINIILAAFNLIPLPPLDGSKILMGFAPSSVRQLLVRIEPYGLLILIGMLYFGVLDPVIGFFEWIILAAIKLFLL